MIHKQVFLWSLPILAGCNNIAQEHTRYSAQSPPCNTDPSPTLNLSTIKRTTSTLTLYHAMVDTAAHIAAVIAAEIASHVYKTYARDHLDILYDAVKATPKAHANLASKLACKANIVDNEHFSDSDAIDKLFIDLYDDYNRLRNVASLTPTTLVAYAAQALAAETAAAFYTYRTAALYVAATNDTVSYAADFQTYIDKVLKLTDRINAFARQTAPLFPNQNEILGYAEGVKESIDKADFKTNAFNKLHIGTSDAALSDAFAFTIVLAKELVELSVQLQTDRKT